MITRDGQLTFFARTNFRDQRKPFGIRQADRRSHMYVIGKTGTGKTTLLETMVRQDMANDNGLALFDPHGDLVERVRLAIPNTRNDNVIYFNVPDRITPLAFNPLADVPAHLKPLAASNMLEVFKKIWTDSWGPRLEHLLRNALFTLLDQPEATLADVLRLLDDKEYRKRAVDRVHNPEVRNFWLREYQAYPIRFRAEAIAPVQNKVGAFLSNPILRSILTQPRNAFDLRDVMDHGKILLVNLAKGKIGEDSAALLGALMVARIGLTGLSRADVAEDRRRDFALYLDEFQTFTTLSMANMLSELRKYRVHLVLAHQYLAQLDPDIRDAILGNVGTTIAFRVGPADAEVFEREFAPECAALDFINLPNYHIYLKLMVGGAASRPFSAQVLPPAQITSEPDRLRSTPPQRPPPGTNPVPPPLIRP